MPEGLFKLAGIVTLLVWLLLLGTTAWATQEDTRQQQKDALVITAIRISQCWSSSYG